MSLDWQELPGDYLNLTTQRGYTVDEARDLINWHLLARGYTLLQHDEVLSVTSIAKIDPGMVPRVDAEELSQRQPHEFVKVSFELDWLVAESAEGENLLKNVEVMIKTLDEAARPLSSVSTVKLDGGVNAAKVREVLSRLLEETRSPSSSIQVSPGPKEPAAENRGEAGNRGVQNR